LEDRNGREKSFMVALERMKLGLAGGEAVMSKLG
jgi:hypothetical protein